MDTAACSSGLPTRHNMETSPYTWWRSLSINEMKAFEKKHFPIVFQFNGQTITMANHASFSQIAAIYRAEHGLNA